MTVTIWCTMVIYHPAKVKVLLGWARLMLLGMSMVDDDDWVETSILDDWHDIG